MFCLAIALASSRAVYPPHYRVRKTVSNMWVFNGSAIESLSPTHGEIYKAEFERAMTNLSDVDVDIIENLAASKYAPALHVLGDLALFGSGVPQDFKRAAASFEEAAESGFGESLARLAFLHRHGLGVPRDDARDTLYRDVACTNGSLYACTSRAWSYFYGIGVPKSVPYAVDTLMQFMDQGSPVLTNDRVKLGYLRANLELNNKKAKESRRKEVEMIKYGVQMGDPGAEVDLGVAHYTGRLDVPQDYARAKELFERNQADPHALMLLGRMHLLGEGVDVDYARAEEYLQAAAEHHEMNAMTMLAGLLDRRGEREKAWELVEEAAALGHPDALEKVAQRQLLNGNVTEADETLDRGGGYSQIVKLRAKRAMNGLYEPAEVWYQLTKADNLHWEKTAGVAEEMWEMGNRQGAVILWLELADIGIISATYNAMVALRHCELVSNSEKCFLPEDQRWKLVGHLGRRLLLADPTLVLSDKVQIFDWLQEADERRGKKHNNWPLVLEQLIHVEDASSFWLAKAQLSDVLTFNSTELFEHCITAMTQPMYHLEGLVLLLRTLRVFASKICQIINDRSIVDEDFYQFLVYLCNRFIQLVPSLLGFVLLIYLLRLRVETLCH